SAGVVSSVPYSHATPAAYVAHEADRNNYHAIADQELASELSVVMGAGHPYFDDSHERLDAPEYGYMSEESYEALAAGETDWSYIEEASDFEDLASGETRSACSAFRTWARPSSRAGRATRTNPT